jgi:ADP-ribose pyrophosphatase YjhB (NUDIX family)
VKGGGEVATASDDISWTRPAGTFNLRVAGIITQAGNILLCSVAGLGYWFLPGGRVRQGESSDAALTRELAEELGQDLPAGALALIVENIYADQTPQHEIGLYYDVTWPAELATGDLDGGTEPGHLFSWVPLRQLGSAAFEPAGLIPVLQEPRGTVRHVILVRR